MAQKINNFQAKIERTRDEAEDAVLLKVRCILQSRFDKLAKYPTQGGPDNQDLGYQTALQEISRLLDSVKAELAFERHDCRDHLVAVGYQYEEGGPTYRNNSVVACSFCDTIHDRSQLGLPEVEWGSTPAVIGKDEPARVVASWMTTEA